MDKYTYFYGQVVTDSELNDSFNAIESYLQNQNVELENSGIFSGMEVSPTSPESLFVEVTSGAAREAGNGFRIPISVLQTFSCEEDEYSNSTYSDLLAGEGRWVTLYVRYLRDESNPRTDKNGTTINYDQLDSFELFIRRGVKGLIGDKATLSKPALIPTAVLLTDIWIENGSINIGSGDIDYNRRENYFRRDLLGTTITANSIKDAIQALADSVGIDLLNADQPTGADDGAHYVGLGGHDSQSAFQWADGNYLTADGDTVHEAIEKIVKDLGASLGQGKAGGRLISADVAIPDWANLADLGAYSSNDGSIMGAIRAIVLDLASSNGENLIGVPTISGTYLGESYSITTADTIKEQVEILLEKVLTRIDVEGDNRIAGDLVPSTSNTRNLGSSSNLFASVYTNQVLSSSSHCEIGSTDGTGGGTAFKSYDSIIAYLETLSGTPTLHPVTNNGMEIGSASKLIKEIFTSDITVNKGAVTLEGGALVKDTDAKVSTLMMTAASSIQSYLTLRISSDGDYVFNQDTSDVFFFPVNLRVNQIIQSIIVYGGHSTAADITVELMYYNIDGGYAVIAGNNFSGAGYADIALTGIGHKIDASRIPVVKIRFATNINQRIYNCRIEYNEGQWPA